jgi:PIN domain nuclease of toxin-antitoxin system
LGKQPLKFLLDTHALVWWLQGENARLTKRQDRALAELQEAGEPAALSAISLWELAMLRERGRIGVTRAMDEMFREIEFHPLLTILPLTCSVAAESVRLGYDFHRDPADQIIVATARCYNLTLITADDRIRNWGKVRVL